MKRKIFFSVLFTVILLVVASAAMAKEYKIKVIIDGSAILPDKEVEVYFTLKPTDFHELYWVGYDKFGACKGLRTTTYTYPHTFNQSDCSFTVTFDKPLTKIEATTGYGTKPSKSFGGGISEWKIIGIRKNKIDD